MKLFLICAYIGLVLLPIVIGLFIFNSTGLVLTNLTLHNWADFGSYTAWVEQAREGHVLFKQLFSTESPNGYVMIHPLFLLMGILVKTVGLSSVAGIVLLRVVGAVLVIIAGNKLLKYFDFSGVQLHITRFVLFFGSGIGWLLFPGGVDTRQSESSIFFSVYASVLNPISLAIIIAILILILDEKIRYRILYISGLIISLVFVHLYDIIPVFAIWGVWALIDIIREKNVKKLHSLLKVVVITTPFILLQLYILSINVPLGIWAFIQTAVASPSLYEHFTVYILLYVFAVAGIAFTFGKNVFKKYVYLIAWLGVQFILMYNPFTDRYQQKFSLGFYVPLAILASVGVVCILDELKNKAVYYTMAIVLGLLLIGSNVSIVTESLEAVRLKPDEWFLQETSVSAIQQLSTLGCTGAVISSYELSNRIPGMTGCQVYYGHYDQTVNGQVKYSLLQNAISSRTLTTGAFKEFLKQNDIQFIIVDAILRSWDITNLSSADYLSKIYDNGDIQIYSVN